MSSGGSVKRRCLRHASGNGGLADTPFGPGRPDNEEDDPARPSPFVADRGSKALTVAIAGALAAPIAAQAVDFTISGHVNKALVVVDHDMSTDAQVKDNGSSSTRIRWIGSSEMMDGTSVGIQVEYQESGSSLSLRHANVHYAGEFGKITIGQGSEAGDGSAYSDPSGVFGIGHGQEKGDVPSDYFGSLDGGTRAHMIRYDTPAIGPLSAAVSVGNNDDGNDRISAALRLGTEFNGTSFSAQLATLREDSMVEGKAKETFGGSFGASLASGLTVSGAWARGDNHGSKEAVPEMDMEAMEGTDPSYFQAAIGYKFGNSAIAASWYASEDFEEENLEGTAIGIGINHNLPKVGAQVYASVQNYDVSLWDENEMMEFSDDATVFVVGTRVKF